MWRFLSECKRKPAQLPAAVERELQRVLVRRPRVRHQLEVERPQLFQLDRAEAHRAVRLLAPEAQRPWT